MAFASAADRVSLLETTFPSLMSVQIVTCEGREIELAADDVEHALNIQADWMRRGARQCEIFRVLRDGSLNPTIGKVTATEWTA